MKFTHIQINVAIKYVYVDNKAAYVFTVAMILSQKKRNKKTKNLRTLFVIMVIPMKCEL